MDGWVGGWMGGWVYAWIHEWMDKWMNGWMRAWMHDTQQTQHILGRRTKLRGTIIQLQLFWSELWHTLGETRRGSRLRHLYQSWVTLYKKKSARPQNYSVWCHVLSTHSRLVVFFAMFCQPSYTDWSSHVPHTPARLVVFLPCFFSTFAHWLKLTLLQLFLLCVKLTGVARASPVCCRERVYAFSTTSSENHILQLDISKNRPPQKPTECRQATTSSWANILCGGQV